MKSGGAAVMSATVVAMGHFCWQWPHWPGAVGGARTTWVTAVGTSARRGWARV